MNKPHLNISLLPTVLSFLSIALALYLASFTIGDSRKIWLYSISMAALFSTGVFLICYGYRKKISSSLWKWKYKKRCCNNKIGVLNEKGCPRQATSFTVDYWIRQLNKKHNINKITFSDIDDSYIAIINPYGEVYNEENYTTYGTFNKIRTYVKNGGIFVSAGGLAFWWGWDKKNKRFIPTAKEIYSYGGTIKTAPKAPKSSITLIPTVMLGQHSLIDTLTNKHFKLLTTVWAPQLCKAYQTDEDKNFCGNIENIGNITDVIEFRAGREPLPKCYPMLRINLHGTIIYPILAIPDGRGLFIFGGMNLDYNFPSSKIIINKTQPTKLTIKKLKRITSNQIKKIIKGLDNIIENETLLKIEKNEI